MPKKKKANQSELEQPLNLESEQPVNQAKPKNPRGKPVAMNLKQLIKFLIEHCDKDDTHEALTWAMNERARETHFRGKTELLQAYGLDKNLPIMEHLVSESSIRAYEKLGLRPDHLISLSDPIWHSWKGASAINLIVGAHNGTSAQSKDSLASIYDLEAMHAFLSYVDSQVPGHVRTELTFNKPSLSEFEEYGELQKKFASDQDELKNRVASKHIGAVFSFGSPFSNVSTSTIERLFFPTTGMVPDDFPQIAHFVATQQLNSELFFIGPDGKDSRRHTLRNRKDAKLLHRPSMPAKILEDFGIVGMALLPANATPLDPLAGVAIGFAAGIGKHATLAAAHALKALSKSLFTNEATEPIYRFKGEAKAIALVRVCFESQNEHGNSSTYNPDVTLLSTDRLGWNLVPYAQLEYR